MDGKGPDVLPTPVDRRKYQRRPFVAKRDRQPEVDPLVVDVGPGPAKDQNGFGELSKGSPIDMDVGSGKSPPQVRHGVRDRIDARHHHDQARHWTTGKTGLPQYPDASGRRRCRGSHGERSRLPYIRAGETSAGPQRRNYRRGGYGSVRLRRKAQ